MTYHYEATYSPEDNKLRLRGPRMEDDEYQQARGAGFRWAPKQEVFFTTWSPQAEDLAVQMAGEIGDENTTREGRAEDRAARFEGYEANRLRDAEQAHQAVEQIADGIPLGQPILVGHHSEKRARKDAEKIERGMAKAVKMWETSKYWKGRAAGVIRHAAYVDRADVRARRIKKLEAERRKFERQRERAEFFAEQWARVGVRPLQLKGGGEASPYDHALFIANRDHLGSQWSEIRDGKRTPEQARDYACAKHRENIEWNQRWLAHLGHRLDYERTLLEAQGESDLLKPKARKKQPPILNYRAELVPVRNMYDGGKVSNYAQVEMTKAEWADINKDYKGTRLSGDGTHRVRSAMHNENGGRGYGGLVCVFLTDSKTHPIPEGVAA